jgi:uncharacterized protein YigE (DUF2233 family)
MISTGSLAMTGSRCFWVCALAWCILGRNALAAEFGEAKIAGKRVTVCTVDLLTEQIQLFLRDDSRQAFKSFEAVEQYLTNRGQTLVFAMNAGMFQRDFSPVGLFVAGGRELTPLNTNSGYGNFFMKPNGIFVVTDAGPRVIETSEYPKLKVRTVLATQSGPLLVHSGKIHPVFNTNSTSRVIRNGVGVSGAGKVVFAISEEPVNLHEFAVLFRDVLGCPNALYLDGVISSLHAPALKRSDKKTEMGPIIGVVEARR